MSAFEKMCEYLEKSGTFAVVTEERLLLHAITAEAKRLLAEEQEQQKDPTYLIDGLRMWAEHSPVFTSKKERDEYKKFLSQYTPVPEKREEPLAELAELAERKGIDSVHFIKYQKGYYGIHLIPVPAEVLSHPEKSTYFRDKSYASVKSKASAFLNSLPDVGGKP